MPHVSIIIPTHNRPQMLKEAVESALAQTFRDFEIIIFLNGASAGSVEMAHRFQGDPGFKIVEMQDSTLAASRNFGLGFAQGEWIAFLDDDDIWLPEKLEPSSTRRDGPAPISSAVISASSIKTASSSMRRCPRAHQD
jgi:glycosyltransferase involved in cell wall biosynthesis